MKKTFIAFCILAATVFAARGQQMINGENIADFNAVNLSGQMSVELIPADKPAVEMELHDFDSNRLTWGVTGTVLNIRVKPSGSKGGTMLVRIFYRSVQSLAVSAADVRIGEPLRSVMLDVDLSAGARLGAALECVDVKVDATGNSAAQFTGRAEYLTVEAGQRSNVDARELETRSVEVDSRLGSQTYVWGTKRVVSHANTGGAVFYKGDPEVLRVSNFTWGTTDNIGK
jgi:hypothetical protein